MKYQSLGLHLTDKCNMRCSHCITEASPNGSNVMSLEMARTAIEKSVGYFSNICITGGEALLYPELVATILKLIYSNGFTSSLVSNCYWVKDNRQYETILKMLNQNHLSKLAISFDGFHEKKLFDSTDLVKILADDRRCFSIVVQPCFLDETSLIKNSESLKILCHRYNCDYEPSTIVPFGRAKTIVPESNNIFSEEAPCDVVRLPLLKFNGEYSVCCGPAAGSPSFSPLIYESYNTDTLEKTKNDLIINSLFLYGPHFLYNKLTDSLKEKVINFSRHVDSACGLCRAICDQKEIVEYLYKVLENERWIILCSSELEGEI